MIGELMWNGQERRAQNEGFEGDEKRKDKKCSMDWKSQQDETHNYIHCERESEIRLLIYQVKQIQEFFEEIKPIIIFAESEKKRREAHLTLCSELTKEVMKWGLVGILTISVTYLWNHFNSLTNK